MNRAPNATLARQGTFAVVISEVFFTFILGRCPNDQLGDNNSSFVWVKRKTALNLWLCESYSVRTEVDVTTVTQLRDANFLPKAAKKFASS